MDGRVVGCGRVGSGGMEKEEGVAEGEPILEERFSPWKEGERHIGGQLAQVGRVVVECSFWVSSAQ